MIVRLGLTLALAAAAVLATAPLAAPANDPEPLATLAPLSIPNAETPDPVASGSEKVLGHIYTTAFCSRFVEHYNVAATTLIGNDRRMDAAGVNVEQIADDYKRRDGALRIVDHRNQLIAAVGEMMRSIPVGQSAVNDLLQQAKETTDEERRQALHESASQLQRSVDRQRAVAYDLSNYAHVLMDKHKKEDTAEYRIQQTLPPGMPPVNITALDDPVPEPGDVNPALIDAPGHKAATVKEVLQWDRQRSIIRDAESNAQIAAGRIVTVCTDHRK